MYSRSNTHPLPQHILLIRKNNQPIRLHLQTTRTITTHRPPLLMALTFRENRPRSCSDRGGGSVRNRLQAQARQLNLARHFWIDSRTGGGHEVYIRLAR